MSLFEFKLAIIKREDPSIKLAIRYGVRLTHKYLRFYVSTKRINKAEAKEFILTQPFV